MPTRGNVKVFALLIDFPAAHEGALGTIEAGNELVQVGEEVLVPTTVVASVGQESQGLRLTWVPLEVAVGTAGKPVALCRLLGSRNALLESHGQSFLLWAYADDVYGRLDVTPSTRVMWLLRGRNP